MSLAGRCVLGTVLSLATCGVAAAQQPLTLQIHDGQVSLKAENVPVRTILNEWAKVGGTQVTGAEGVTGAAVTLELNGVPERQALDVLLRNASGYMLVLRPAGSQGASSYNRILIMPPSVAPRVVAAPPTPFAPRLPPPPVNDDDSPVEIGVSDAPGPAVRPGPPIRQPVVTGPNVPTPLPLPETSAPTSSPTPGPVVTTPGNPFGLPAGSSSQPGVISPVPPPQPGPRPEGN